MRRSDKKLLTSHVGSLPYLVPLDKAEPDYAAKLEQAVAAVVEKQRSLGIHIMNEGEYAKGGDWLSYLEDRFGGFEPRAPKPGAKHLLAQGKDREDFAEFYQYKTDTGTLFYEPGGLIRRMRPSWVCTSPITYQAEAALAREIALLQKSLKPGEEGFITTTAPASLEPYRENEFYKTEEEFLVGIAGAMRHEYQAIVKAGLVLQVDDAWLPALWDRIGMQMGLEAFKKRSMLRVDILNDALKGIPEDRIRYHLCWGSWHGPHAYDLEMKDIIDVMLRVKAGAYSFEAANARHEHEYAVWESVKLPAGKIILPGVITHSTDVIEHPKLVAQRIVRFAKLVGKENVIASADCGFGGRSHPQIAWAKLKALGDGAALATKELKYA